MIDDAPTTPSSTPRYDPKLKDLFKTAWKGENYAEAYRYATMMVEQAPDSVRAWTNKGLCAGYLSTPANPRIREMVACLKKASELAAVQEERDYVSSWAIRASWLVNEFWIKLHGSFGDQQQLNVDINRQRVPVLPQKSFSESIGAGIGAGLAEAMSQNSEAKKAAERLGNVFTTKYQEPIAEGLECAWAIGVPSEMAAENIAIVVGNIMNTEVIGQGSKLAFRQRIQPLLDHMRESFPEVVDGVPPAPEAKGSGCNPCCFTVAAAGTADHPDVRVLRDYRDRKLAYAPLGWLLIRTYYRCSPPLAAIVSTLPWLRSISYRYILRPLAARARESLAASTR